jgi:hypothetical protein
VVGTSNELPKSHLHLLHCLHCGHLSRKDNAAIPKLRFGKKSSSTYLFSAVSKSTSILYSAGRRSNHENTAGMRWLWDPFGYYPITCMLGRNGRAPAWRLLCISHIEPSRAADSNDFSVPPRERSSDGFYMSETITSSVFGS